LLARQREDSPEAFRSRRAVAVLERMATKEARQLLRRLADGAAGALLTREAKAALERQARLKPGR
jgi:hypothetical protein